MTGPVHQGRYAGRFETRQGDDVYGCCRSEVSYGRLASMVVREGDERIVTWSTMFDPSWQAYPGDWQIFHQWHTESGSPPLSLNVMGETIYLGSYGYGRTPVGKLERGTWHDFELPVKFSSRAASGYVELLDPAKVVLPRRPFAALKGGGAYLKMGLYRRPTIAARQVVYHDRVKVARP